MLNVSTLVARVIVDNASFNAGMGEVEGRMAAVGASMRATGSLMTQAITLPTLLAAGAAVKMGIDFQREMEMIHTQAGASQAEVDKMTKAVEALAPATAFGPGKLAEALYHIESVGAHGTNALNILHVAADGAAVGNANLEDTASALAGTMRVYHVEASGAAGIMGDLNAIVGAGNMRMQDLNNAISTGLLPTASGLGVGLKEVGAAMATMTDESVPASVAATRLRTLLLLMTGETKKSRDTLEGIGITQGELADKMRQPGGMIPALQDLRDHLEHLGKSDQIKVLAEAFGGSRSAGTIIQLLNNLGMVQTKLDQINKTAGNFPQDVIANQATEAYRMHQAWAAIQTVLVQVGGILAPVVVQIAVAISQAVEAFTGLSKPMQDLIVYGGLVAAAIGPVLFILGALLSPVGLVVAAIAGLIAVGIMLYNNFAPVRQLFDNIGTSIRGFTDAIGLTHAPFQAGATDFGKMSTEMTRFHQISNALHNAWAAIAPDLVNAMSVVSHAVGVVVTFVVQQFQSMMNGIKAHSAEIRAFLSAAWNDIVSVAHVVWPILQRTIEMVWDAIKIIIRTAMQVIGNVILAIMDIISGNWSGAWHAIQRATMAILTGIVQLIGVILREGIPIALSIAEAIGTAIWNGIKKVASLLAGLAGILMSGIASAVSGVVGWAAGEAAAIGKAIADGIINGVGDLGGSLAGKLKSAIGGAIASAKHGFGIFSPSRVTHAEIGVPLGQGIVEGYLMGINDLPTKMSSSLRTALEHAKQVVQNSQTELSTAFQRLADYALRAFDATTQAHLNVMQTDFEALIKKKVTDPMNKALAALDAAHQKHLDAISATAQADTPTEALIKQLQEQHSEADRQANIEQAQKSLAEAQSGGDPQAILNAQKDLSNALYEEQIAGLQKQAGAERTAADALAAMQTDAENAKYDKQKQAIQDRYDALQKSLTDRYNVQVLNYQSERDLQRQHLDDMLTDMEAQLAKHPQLWQHYHDIIMAKFKKDFGPDYKTAGKNLGLGFAEGLRESQAAVKAAATSLAATVAAILKLHSPAKEGPMSDLNSWWAPMTQTLLAGLDGAGLQRGLNGYVPSPSAAVGVGAGAAGTRQGDTIVQITVPDATFLSGDRTAARDLATLLTPYINQGVSITK